MAFFVTTTIAGGLVTLFMLMVIRGLEKKSSEKTCNDVEEGFAPFLSDLRRVLVAAVSVFHDGDTALRWVTSVQVPAFRQKTAVAMVVDGRVEDVLRYLGSESPRVS